jgi:hypothetical protein
MMRYAKLAVRLCVVLLVADVFEPGDMLAVEMLLHCNVHHVGLRPRAVPVLFRRCNPNRVARADLAHRTAPQLDAPDAREDMQCLTERMGVSMRFARAAQSAPTRI